MLPDTCKKCGTQLSEFSTERKKIGDELHCNNCYCEELGKLVEQCPIGTITSPQDFIVGQ